MKTIFTSLLASLYVTVFGLNWTSYGPIGIHANSILFGAGSHGYDVICTNTGVCVNNGSAYTWHAYNYGMPAWEAVPYDTNNVLLIMGNGSYSDGIYKFNLTDNSFSVVEWIPFSTFIKYCPINDTYYAGSRYSGLYRSADGINWDTVSYFHNKGCAAMDFYEQHIVVVQENNIYATYYSDDEGINWNQSSSNIPIHDLAFDQNGVLYGVFTGNSNSSGLYISHDFGHTWDMEYFIDNINVVGFDVVGNLFTGFHDALPTFEGVAIYDTATNNFSFLNNGLPNKNINSFKINPILSSITIFACTDTGVYFCNNYITEIQDVFFDENNICIYPNPATDKITIISSENAAVEIFNIQGQFIKEISHTSSEIKADISELTDGVYMIKIKTQKAIPYWQRTTVKKLIKH